MTSKLSRRDFLTLGAGAALGSAVGVRGIVGQRAANQNAGVQTAAVLPTRLLGQTGERVTIFGLGGASSKTPLQNGPHETAVAIVDRARQLGVKYFDTAYSYGNGNSERAIGDVAKTHRKEMFLTSKSNQRSYDGAMREL